MTRFPEWKYHGFSEIKLFMLICVQIHSKVNLTYLKGKYMISAKELLYWCEAAVAILRLLPPNTGTHARTRARTHTHI